MDHRPNNRRLEGDDVAALLRGLRLGLTALVCAAVTAGLVIGLGRGLIEADHLGDAPYMLVSH